MPPTFNPGKSFIEIQFPVSKISKESYKERKSVQSQTLTSLGKWWGRKPLILCRAAILGLLFPATTNPVKDREIFLKLLTMDEEGLFHRKNKNIPLKELIHHLNPEEIEKWAITDEQDNVTDIKPNLTRDERNQIQRIVFSRLSYDKKLEYCNRPEQIEGPSNEAWKEINEYFGLNVKSLPELMTYLGQCRFGEIPLIGDCFCGGGNIPFEAARMGFNIFASDLNPVAGLLTWADINIIGGDEEVQRQIVEAQNEVYSAVDKLITEWGVEHNEIGWRADAYLYCTEIICPECSWHVPLAPSWIIGGKSHTIGILHQNSDQKRYEIEIRSNATSEEINIAEKGTIVDSYFKCPNPKCPANISPISIDSLRHNKMRLWEKEDIIPRIDDIFQERLYCIRWVKADGDRIFKAPVNSDFEREEKVLSILNQNFSDWQKKGYIPNEKIEEGQKTLELIRTRGWAYWHQLFTPRQLLTLGLFSCFIGEGNFNKHQKAYLLLSLGRLADWCSKLCRWGTGAARESIAQTFYNQAYNTLLNFGNKGLLLLRGQWFIKERHEPLTIDSTIFPEDSRNINKECAIWITDPPYADAINYHELSEFFLAWYETHLKNIFPEWYVDSKRAFAIQGSDLSFRQKMIETYRNLTSKLNQDGFQIVMFTHQDAGVWADLALILWASGLRVTAAWCIQTETGSAGIKTGNYVQGTVVLVLRKQNSKETAFLDEIYPEIELEVKRQLDAMLSLDDKDDPNFGDTDYQLAAYAAALRILTKYKKIEEINIEYEISRIRQSGEKSPLELVIENAVKIACDHLVPQGIDSFLWKQLGPEERFYLKGLELESHGEYRIGAYQELARGFGIRSYRDLQESGRANETRLRTASEFRDRYLSDEGFGSSLVRQVLFAIRQTRMENDTSAGKVWLRGLANYWDRRKDIIGILFYLAALGSSDIMPQWHEDAKSARLLAGAVEQDHI